MGCFRLLSTARAHRGISSVSCTSPSRIECVIKSNIASVAGRNPRAFAPAAARMLQEVVISLDYCRGKTIQKIWVAPVAAGPLFVHHRPDTAARTGLSKVGAPGVPVGLQKRDITIAQALKPLGYATGQFGKNHLGDRDEYLPTNQGFDEFFGNLYHLNAEEEPERPSFSKTSPPAV